MSKRAKEKAELIANGIMISVQGKTGRVVYNTKEKSFTHYELMCAAQKGYSQAEKETIERVVSWLIKNVDYYIGSMEFSRCLPIKYHVSCACWADLKAFIEEDNG